MISPLRKHTLLQPSRVASALDHLVNFLQGPLDGVTAPASAYRARELWKGLFWVFKQAIEVSAQALRRVFVGVFRASHSNPLALFAREFDLRCTCHRSASPCRGWRVE
jgi:hypothetical protein